MRIPMDVYAAVGAAERAVNEAGRRALAAREVQLTPVPRGHLNGIDDDLNVLGLFLEQAMAAITPLINVYDWANRDNRVDIADVQHLGQYLRGLREVIELWEDRISESETV